MNLIGLREPHCIASFSAVVTNWYVIRACGEFLLFRCQQMAMA